MAGLRNRTAGSLKTAEGRKNVARDCAFPFLRDIFSSFCRPERSSRPVASVRYLWRRCMIKMPAERYPQCIETKSFKTRLALIRHIEFSFSKCVSILLLFLFFFYVYLSRKWTLEKMLSAKSTNHLWKI